MFKCPICLGNTAHEDRREFQLSEEGANYAICPFCYQLITALRNSEKVTQLSTQKKIAEKVPINPDPELIR